MTSGAKSDASGFGGTQVFKSRFFDLPAHLLELSEMEFRLPIFSLLRIVSWQRSREIAYVEKFLAVEGKVDYAVR